MKVIYINKDFSNIDTFCGKLDLCLGYFDGVHLGHQSLIRCAKEKGTGALGIITFKQSNKYSVGLTSIDDRLRIFNSLGIDITYVLPSIEEIKDVSADEFIDKFFLKINPSRLFISEDFTFGKGALGNHLNLEKLFDVFVVPFIKDDNKKISSGDIISIIQRDGDIKKANRLLNRNYEVVGSVVKGYGYGRKLGYPTANIKLSSNYVLPKNGVYSVLIYIDGIPFKGMANVGTHPTINELSEKILEVHILNFSRDIYGRTVYVAFLDRIRDEKKFSSIDELKAQIISDLEFID